MLTSYLHNLTTAKRFKTESTGNAGWIEPDAWNLEVRPGDSGYSEMVKEMKRGIDSHQQLVHSLHELQDGEFSTVPRDGTFLVEKGA